MPFTDSIKIDVKTKLSNSEQNQILDFQNIDFFTLKFSGKGLINKYFCLITKEMWNGKLKKVDTVLNSKTNYVTIKVETDTLTLKVIGGRIEDNKLKFVFRLPMVGMTRYYKGIKSYDYSLRGVRNQSYVGVNKPFNLLTYILPYEVDGSKRYCEVDGSGINIEEWGKKFKIKHYLIFEMMFMD